jgi:hypothetical protein
MWANEDLSLHGGVMLPLRTAAVALVALMAIGSAQGGNAKLQSWCVPFIESNGERIQCHLRTNDATAVVEATATLADGQRLKGTLTDYNSDKYTSAWYFLIQASGVTPAQIGQMSETVANLASFEGKQCVATATYSDSLFQRTQCGALKKQVGIALREIQSAAPAAPPPALYKSARDAILKLDAMKADRKALVILSNGANTDSSVTESEVVDLARARNVVIFGLSFGDRASGRPQNVWRLAEKTFGTGRDLSDQSAVDIAKFASTFPELLENGGVLTFDAKDLPQDAKVVLSARLRDSTILRTPPIAVRRITQDTSVAWLRRLLLENIDSVTTVLAAAALLFGLLLIFASLRGRWRAAHSFAPLGPDIEGVQFDEPASPSPAPPPIERKPVEGPAESDRDAGDGNRPDTVYGWLQFLDADSTRVPVTATTVRIGRHPDNDICLPNKSVHRQHAVLHKTTNGAFVIRDLGTKNGLIVNGKRCSEHTLADNDLIELGEVRLRFASNAGNLH